MNVRGEEVTVGDVVLGPWGERFTVVRFEPYAGPVEVFAGAGRIAYDDAGETLTLFDDVEVDVIERHARRRVVVPDLDGEPPVTVLGPLEEILLTLNAWDDDGDDGQLEPLLPTPLAGGRALALVHRLQDVLRPTQHLDTAHSGTGGSRGGRGARGRLLGPDGRREHMPMTVVDIDAADVDTLAQLARTLAHADQHEDVLDAVEGLADLHQGLPALVQQTASLAGILDLAWTDDTRRLEPLLQRTAAGETVVLDQASEAAYQRLATRLNTIAAGDSIDRWLY